MVNYTDHAKKLTEIADLIERFKYRIETIETSYYMTEWLFFTVEEKLKSKKTYLNRVENIQYIIGRLEKYYTKKAKEIWNQCQ